MGHPRECFDGLEDGEVQRSSDFELNFTYCIFASESKRHFRRLYYKGQWALLGLP
jgi:hypothetical protein